MPPQPPHKTPPQVPARVETLDEAPPELLLSHPEPQGQDPISLEVPEDGPSLGDKEDRYELLKVLGRGGMGVVYKARDRELDRLVAVKTLKPEVGEHKKLLEFLSREARTLASLRHMGLPSIYDVLREEDQLTIVMEYVRGQPLDEVLDRHPNGLPPQEGLQIWLQLLAALAYLHRNGFIHRDIKPANLMLNSRGELRLVDFGLAREVEHIHREGTRIRGTPTYMAPEQIQNLRLTAATDLYAAAVTLYELLTGRLPFPHSKSPAFHHLHTPPQPLQVHSAAPMPLCQQINACLQKRPLDRPLRAEDMIQELVEALALDPRALPSAVQAELRSLAPLAGGLLVATDSDLWQARETPPQNSQAHATEKAEASPRTPPPLPTLLSQAAVSAPVPAAPRRRSASGGVQAQASAAQEPPTPPALERQLPNWLVRLLMLGGLLFFSALLLGALTLATLWLK